MVRIHADPITYNNINNSVFNLPSPSSVILNNCNLFNTTEFNIENKILKAKILNINKKNILDIVFTFNNEGNYNLWKCKLNINNDKIHNKIIKTMINPIINTNIKIKTYKFIKNKILLIDIFNDYNNPSETSLLSKKIIQTHNNIINNLKEKSTFYKINNYFCKIIVNICDGISSKYDDFMIEALSEELMDKLVKSN